MVRSIFITCILCFHNFLILGSQIIPATDSIIKKEDSTSININTYVISDKQASCITSFAGEKDILKLIQLTPGITNSCGNTDRMAVHGFASSSGLVLMDGVEVFNPYHMYNSTAIFQPDIVSSINLISNKYPANYGGRLFSVIDVSIKEGDKKAFHSTAEINPVSANLLFEGPIIKNKLSFIFSSRYNYSSLVENWDGYKEIYIDNMDNTKKINEIGFFDITGKLSFDLNDKNRFTYLISHNSDRVDLSELCQIKYSTHIEKFQWDHSINKKLILNNSLSYSNFAYSNTYHYRGVDLYTLLNGQSETSLKSELNYFYKSNNYLKFGFSCNLNQIQPFELSSDGGDLMYINSDKSKSITTSLFIEDKLTAGKLTFNVGLRYNAFSTYGKKTLYNYSGNQLNEKNIMGSTEYSDWQSVDFFQSLEPRLNMEIQLNQNNLINFSYSYAKQFLHNINANSMYYAEIWYPSDRYLKPQSAHHFSLGYKHSFLNDLIDAGAESYYALIHNLNEPKNGAVLLFHEHPETDIAVGSGKTSGINFFLKKNAGKFSGWMSYTLSKSMMQFKEINDNKEFHASYDKPHNFSLVLFYELTKNWTLSSDFCYFSGGYTTMPYHTYNVDGNTIIYYFDRNNYELDNYRRLDISVTYKTKSRSGKFKNEINIGIYNILNERYYSAIQQTPAPELQYNLNTVETGGIIPFLNFRTEF